LHHGADVIPIYCIKAEAYNPSIARMPRHRRKNSMSSVQCSNPAVVASPATAASRAGILPLVALAIGFIMAMLDVTVVNVGLSEISASLDAPLSTLVWIVDGYTLTFAAMLMVGGALADRFGGRRLYLLGLFLFVLASALCGAAPNGACLVAARLLQGLGAAFFMPSSLSLLTHIYADDRVRARMLGVWSATVSVAAAVGPSNGSGPSLTEWPSRPSRAIVSANTRATSG